jgi:Mg-chelatase subunit ChlI
MLDLQEDFFNSNLFGGQDSNHELAFDNSIVPEKSLVLSELSSSKAFPSGTTVISLNAAQSVLSARTLNVLKKRFVSDIQLGGRLQGVAACKTKQAPSLWVDLNHEFAAGSGNYELKAEDLMAAHISDDCRQPQFALSGIDAFYQQSEPEIKTEEMFSSLPSFSSAPGSGFAATEAMDIVSDAATHANAAEPKTEKDALKHQFVAPTEVKMQEDSQLAPAAEEKVIVKPKRKRGRPSKRTLAEEAAALLPKLLAKDSKYESEQQCLSGDTSDRLALLLVKAFDKRIQLNTMAYLPEPSNI